MVSPVLIRPVLVILVTAVILFIVTAVYRNGVNRSAPVQSAFQQLPQNMDIALKQARFTEMKDGSVVWELLAEKVEYDKSGEVAHLSGGIRMDFARSRTVGGMKLTADAGEFHTTSKNIKLRGRVNLLTDDGARFDTGSIDYLAAAYRFKTADKVTFSQQRLTLAALGMEMDVREQTARFSSMVEADVKGVSIQRAPALSGAAPNLKSTVKSPVKTSLKKTKKSAVKKGAKKTKKRRKGNINR